MRKLVINTLNLSCYLLLIFWVILGLVAPGFFIPNQPGMVILGGFFGFIVGSISVGIIFILMDIRGCLIKIESNSKVINPQSD